MSGVDIRRPALNISGAESLRARAGRRAPGGSSAAPPAPPTRVSPDARFMLRARCSRDVRFSRNAGGCSIAPASQSTWCAHSLTLAEASA